MTGFTHGAPQGATPKELDGAATRLIEEDVDLVREALTWAEGKREPFDIDRLALAALDRIAASLERERGLVDALRKTRPYVEERHPGTTIEIEFTEESALRGAELLAEIDAALHAVEEPGEQSG